MIILHSCKTLIHGGQLPGPADLNKEMKFHIIVFLVSSVWLSLTLEQNNDIWPVILEIICTASPRNRWQTRVKCESRAPRSARISQFIACTLIIHSLHCLKNSEVNNRDLPLLLGCWKDICMVVLPVVRHSCYHWVYRPDIWYYPYKSMCHAGATWHKAEMQYRIIFSPSYSPCMLLQGKYLLFGEPCYPKQLVAPRCRYIT